MLKSFLIKIFKDSADVASFCYLRLLILFGEKQKYSEIIFEIIFEFFLKILLILFL